MAYTQGNSDGPRHEGYMFDTEYTSNNVTNVPLAHMDFIPVCIDPGGVFSDKKFERFE